ncbi:MAG: TonB family protein [Bacteroidota bacterium]|nr:TonB family protein [Bacteroidota bacterium]MDX5428937.1 TonB family protein [Bacteroidota bacterium]MDX5447992.1 TonB family protein [Bacteroidota bacterium]MDX5506617.1 TonB family protein [Bacteroidota bacterium]
MKSRKTESTDLENYKGLFFWIGMVLTLGFVWIAFEWKTYESSIMDLGTLNVQIEDEIIPITERQQQPPPPPPAAPPEVIQVVENEVEIEEMEFESTEFEETEAVEFIEEVEEETEEIFNFAVVENKPVFPGCENEPTEDAKFMCFQQKIMQFISKEFQFPEMARQMGIQGKVYVNFVVEKDGSISNVQIARGVDKLLDDEAIRVVKRLPKFTPAKQRGKPVRMSYTVPINAKLH